MTIWIITLATLVALLVWKWIMQGKRRPVLAWAVADLIAIAASSMVYLFHFEQGEGTVLPVIFLGLLPLPVTLGLLIVLGYAIKGRVFPKLK